MQQSITKLEEKVKRLQDENIQIIGCLVQSFTLFSNFAAPKSLENDKRIKAEIDEYFNRLMILLEKNTEVKSDR